MRLRLTREFGRDLLHEVMLTSFDALVVFDLAEPAQHFEFVGNRTPDTSSLRLDSLELALSEVAEVTQEPLATPRGGRRRWRGCSGGREAAPEPAAAR